MIPLFSTKTIREVDEFAIKKLRIPGIVLMENASLEVFKFANETLKLAGKSGKIGFICGRGNNGGDGYALARHFINNQYKVIVIQLFDEAELVQDCRTNFIILKQMIPHFKDSKLIKFRNVRDLSPLKNCDMIVDAMLGSGIKGELKEPFQSIVNKVNRLNSIKLSVDIPTGLDADKGYSKLLLHADLTVTLGEFKPGLFFGDGYAFAGKIRKGSIGISPSFYPKENVTEFLIESKDVLNSLPQKVKSVHKYSAGKVLTIAGSGKYPGAAVLTAKSSLKVGAGASILCFPKSIRSFVHKNLSEVVLKEYEDENNEFLRKPNLKGLSDKIKWADVVALGPGLGREEETQSTVYQLLKERNFKKIVIDADGLFAISNKNYKKINIKDFILTPHHGEFCALIGIGLEDLRKDILKFGRKFVKETGAYLVLKGAPTIIFLPTGKVLINTAGNPGMAKFGTGDVLTGIIAGFLCQIKDTEKALITAVYIHSLAADLLLEKYSELGFTATDLMNNIPSAFRSLGNSIV
jgi:ADP-dependent NAD(P)H-hydrate dehydratase / NAD(P)H-hydrate epimerase